MHTSTAFVHIHIIFTGIILLLSILSLAQSLKIVYLLLRQIFHTMYPYHSFPSSTLPSVSPPPLPSTSPSSPIRKQAGF